MDKLQKQACDKIRAQISRERDYLNSELIALLSIGIPNGYAIDLITPPSKLVKKDKKTLTYIFDRLAVSPERPRQHRP
jgi:hypothetical protein